MTVSGVPLRVRGSLPQNGGKKREPAIVPNDDATDKHSLHPPFVGLGVSVEATVLTFSGEVHATSMTSRCPTKVPVEALFDDFWHGVGACPVKNRKHFYLPEALPYFFRARGESARVLDVR